MKFSGLFLSGLLPFGAFVSAANQVVTDIANAETAQGLVAFPASTIFGNWEFQKTDDGSLEVSGSSSSATCGACITNITSPQKIIITKLALEAGYIAKAAVDIKKVCIYIVIREKPFITDPVRLLDPIVKIFLRKLELYVSHHIFI
jgi:hypothetical protein